MDAPMTHLEQTIEKELQRLNARDVANLYDVPLSVVAKAIGCSPKALRRRPYSDSVETGLRVLVESFARLYDVMSRDEKAVRGWLNRPNRGLDGIPPRVLLESGRLSDLTAIVTQIEVGSFA